MTLSDLKDIAAVASSLLSPIIGAYVAVWTYRRQSKERLNMSIVWGTAQAMDGSPEEHPFLWVQNQSDKTVAIIDVSYLNGSFIRRAAHGTALDYEDPYVDLNFPYEIEPGKALRFKLNTYAAERITDAANGLQKLALKIGRSPILIQIRTMGKSRRRLAAHDATPWQGRAKWLK